MRDDIDREREGRMAETAEAMWGGLSGLWLKLIQMGFAAVVCGVFVVLIYEGVSLLREMRREARIDQIDRRQDTIKAHADFQQSLIQQSAHDAEQRKLTRELGSAQLAEMRIHREAILAGVETMKAIAAQFKDKKKEQ